MKNLMKGLQISEKNKSFKQRAQQIAGIRVKPKPPEEPEEPEYFTRTGEYDTGSYRTSLNPVARTIRRAPTKKFTNPIPFNSGPYRLSIAKKGRNEGMGYSVSLPVLEKNSGSVLKRQKEPDQTL